jgi:7-cyano-7-deazaguanine synthase in queuosine biosynthesis
MAKSPALVLSSGGIHSLLVAGVASRDSRIAMLHVRDGRTTASQAAMAFERQVAHFKPFRHWNLDGGFLRQMTLPVETAGLVTSTSSDPYGPLIPSRELNLLMLAAGFARQTKATTIFWGAHIEPKNSEAMARNIETVQIINQLLEASLGEPHLTIRTPLMGLEDGQLLELGYQMGVPFAESWTCQMPGDHPCMACPACSRRTRAFRSAQLTDPLVTAKR